jgi:membrane protease YdiL (CAAX protease family)
MVVSVLATVVAVIALSPNPELIDKELIIRIYSNSYLATVITATSIAAGVAVLALAIRLSRLGMRNYLGLIMPWRRELTIGFGTLASMYVTFGLADTFIWHDQSFFLDSYQYALANGQLTLFAVSIIVVAPLGEEFLFRGFMLRGWAASRLGPMWAIVLTAATWASIHVQYNAHTIAYIFCIGLLLGWLRQRSGSTPLTVLLHAAQNVTVFIHAAIYLWLSAGIAA